MNAIEEALQENIIETHNGMGDYCAFCMLVIEDDKGHSATCPRALALAEYKKLVTALQWYLHDDETSVEMGILESVDKRPAYIALREVCPTDGATVAENTVRTTQAVVKPLAADLEQTTRKIKNARYCIKCGGWLFREGIDRQPTKRTTDEVTTCPKCGRDEFWGGRCHVVGCGSKTN